MLIGLVLLLTSSNVEPIPASERIYSAQAAFEQIKKRLLERRPEASLECFEVHK